MHRTLKGLDLSTEHLGKLKGLVEKHKGKRIAPFFAQVDLDGIGIAAVMLEVLRALGADAEYAYYGGTFSHPQNELVRNKFELEKTMLPMERLPEGVLLFLVDSCKLHDRRFRGRIGADRIIGVIDHHRDDPLVENGRFVLIDSCGAASTIGAQLSKALGVELSEDARVLAALGILSDTDRLTSEATTAADRHAFGELMGSSDQGIVSDCFSFDLPPRFYEVEAECLANTRVAGSFLITHPSRLMTETEGDFLSIIADHLRQREGIKTAVVWGVSPKELRASIRTKSRELNLNAFIEKLFGDGNGGGKHGSGGALVAFSEPFLPTAATAPALIAFCEANLVERIETHVGQNKAA